MRSKAKRANGGRDVWERFRGDKELLARHGVTGEEVAFLETVALFGSLQSVQDIIFILKNIRLSRNRS